MYYTGEVAIVYRTTGYRTKSVYRQILLNRNWIILDISVVNRTANRIDAHIGQISFRTNGCPMVSNPH